MPLNKKNAQKPLMRLKDWVVKHIINQEIALSILGYKVVLNVSVRKAQGHAYLPLHDKIFVNVGAGGFYHKNWINVDKVSDIYKDRQGPNTVNWDLLSLTPFPFLNNSIDLIYMSHVIEHVSDEAAKHFFFESFLKLKVGGEFG